CHPNGGRVAGTVASGKQPPVLNTAAIMGNPTLIRNRIRNGAGGLPTLAEPSFSPTQIRESELNDLVAFLTAPRAAGFVPPTATPLATAIVPAPTATALPVIPIPSNAAGVALTGSASRGEAIFRRGCEVCHANGGRARGPLDQPNLSTNGNTWSPAFVRPWILNGSDRGMPAWKDILNAQEVEDLVRYINIINTFQKPSPAPAVTTVAPTATP
ncbi:MAG: cytochrome c, partial [Chloroflexota bacterium]